MLGTACFLVKHCLGLGLKKCCVDGAGQPIASSAKLRETGSGKHGSHAKKTGSSGHRARLRDRFLSSGGDALADYELLGLLLFQAVPRQDTKPIAKALIRQFETYAGCCAPIGSN
jgi:hypothetical protein